MDKRQLANRIWESANKLRSKIVLSENKIAEMLGELEGAEDDMAGIAAWMKELAR